VGAMVGGGVGDRSWHFSQAEGPWHALSLLHRATLQPCAQYRNGKSL